jgi:ATP-dependent RNA helicase DDX5/DBP2
LTQGDARLARQVVEVMQEANQTPPPELLQMAQFGGGGGGGGGGFRSRGGGGGGGLTGSNAIPVGHHH